MQAMKRVTWILVWAAAWIALTAVLAAWWWPAFITACDDCVGSAPGIFGDGYVGIDFPLTLFFAGSAAGLIVAIVTLAIRWLTNGSTSVPRE
jgi:hypothetical protein